jgi:hypothetical protein
MNLLNTIFLGLSCLTISLAVPALATGSGHEILEAQSLLDQHLSNCTSGRPGWWLKVETYADEGFEIGGFISSSGRYAGCGTCSECRSKLNRRIDEWLYTDKQVCDNRGGVIKSTTKGTMSEDVRSTVWKMSVTGVLSVCEKWVECN